MILPFVFVVMFMIGTSTATMIEQSEENPFLFHVKETTDGSVIGLHMDGSFQTRTFTVVPETSFENVRIFYDFSCYKSGTFLVISDDTYISKNWVRLPGSRTTDGDDPVNEILFNMQAGKEYMFVLAGELYSDTDKDVFLTVHATMVQPPETFSMLIPEFVGNVDVFEDGLLCIDTTIDYDKWATWQRGSDWIYNEYIRNMIQTQAKTPRYTTISEKMNAYSRMRNA